MSFRRLAAGVLAAVGLAGCHDELVLRSTRAAAPQALTVTLSGGAASSLSGALGTGGDGGDFRAFAFGDVLVLSESSPLSAPAAPGPPATSVATTDPDGLSTPGNLLISASLVTTGDAVYESTNGDVIISGTLQGGDDGGGGQFNVTLRAPNGTVFISGTVRTAGNADNDGFRSGDGAGNITVEAARIVLTGTLDARGEDNTAGSGGDGGTVVLDSAAPGVVGGIHVYCIGGSILTAGGNASGASPLSGGAGGNVTVRARGQLFGFTPITTSGGSATESAAVAAVLGGKGGNVTLTGGSGVDVSATLTLRGGAATGGGGGATGGAGGTLASDGLVPLRLFGTLDAPGGDASSSAGAVVGGAGGAANIGQVAGVDVLELGRGSFAACGGGGGAFGGNAGAFDFRTDNGSMLMGAVLQACGGPGTGSGPASGGAGGTLAIVADGDFSGTGSNQSNHTLEFLGGASIDVGGGVATGTGAGGAAGGVLLQSGADLTCGGSITARGGSSPGGPGGSATTGISIVIASFNGAPNGDIFLVGDLQTQGGDSTAAGGGIGGSIAVDTLATAAGEINSSSDLTASGGGGGGGGDGGAPGSITFRSAGVVVVTGVWTADGGGASATGAGGPGALLRVETPSHPAIFFGTLRARGGDSVGGVGGAGGRLIVHTDRDTDGSGGSISIESGASIDVSAGSGAAGGSAANDGVVGVSDPGMAPLTQFAVLLDADGAIGESLADSPAGGIIVNLGTITATGGSTGGAGGDVFFDGRDETGAALTDPLPGTQSRAGDGGVSGSFEGH